MPLAKKQQQKINELQTNQHTWLVSLSDATYRLSRDMICVSIIERSISYSAILREINECIAFLKEEEDILKASI